MLILQRSGAAQRGWNAEEIAAKLTEVSDKTKERSARSDDSYAALTAENALGVVDSRREAGPNL